MLKKILGLSNFRNSISYHQPKPITDFDNSVMSLNLEIFCRLYFDVNI